MFRCQCQRRLRWHIGRYPAATRTKERRVYHQHRFCRSNETASRPRLVQRFQGSRLERKNEPFPLQPLQKHPFTVLYQDTVPRW